MGGLASAAVRFVDAATLPVPMRRARGIDISDSDVVALLEDSSVPGPGWLSAVRSSFTSSPPRLASAAR